MRVCVSVAYTNLFTHANDYINFTVNNNNNVLYMHVRVYVLAFVYLCINVFQLYLAIQQQKMQLHRVLK